VRALLLIEGAYKFQGLFGIADGLPLSANAMMTKTTVYLDHNASAPLLPEARDAIASALELTGNPSSVHRAGRAVRGLIESARDQVKLATGATRDQIVFTGSATEAIAQAVCAGARALGVQRIVTSTGEHAAVLRAAAATGLPVTEVPLLASGLVDLAALKLALEAADTAVETALVALHWVNNETGVVQPLDEIERLVGPTPHFLFIDAVQAFGKRDLDFAARGADMMAISAHKIGGPAGIGALLMKAHCEQARLIPGGGQETGRRGGTEATALIAGFGAAAESFRRHYDAAGVGGLAARAEKGLCEAYDDVVVFGAGAERIGNVVNFAVPGATAATMMMGLDLEGVAVSSGSACSSGKVGRSHVLDAMGVAPELAACALRISFGWSSVEDDVDGFLACFDKVINRARKSHGQAA